MQKLNIVHVIYNWVDNTIKSTNVFNFTNISLQWLKLHYSYIICNSFFLVCVKLYKQNLAQLTFLLPFRGIFLGVCFFRVSWDMLSSWPTLAEYNRFSVDFVSMSLIDILKINWPTLLSETTNRPYKAYGKLYFD